MNLFSGRYGLMLTLGTCALTAMTSTSLIIKGCSEPIMHLGRSLIFKNLATFYKSFRMLSRSTTMPYRRRN